MSLVWVLIIKPQFRLGCPKCWEKNTPGTFLWFSGILSGAGFQPSTVWLSLAILLVTFLGCWTPDPNSKVFGDLQIGDKKVTAWITRFVPIFWVALGVPLVWLVLNRECGFTIRIITTCTATHSLIPYWKPASCLEFFCRATLGQM